MSLRPQSLRLSIPAKTVRIARAAFPKGSPYLTLRDELGTVFCDSDFADLYPAGGQPAYPPWRLALVTLMQFREGLSDRQAADAVRARIDWKYLLGLALDDPGFDHSVLCEFRDRLLGGSLEARLLERLLEASQAHGLLRARGRQRTDSTHVLAAVRALNRLELVAETLRAALNAVATADPNWLRAFAPPEWYERYGRRVENARLPRAEAQREILQRQIGEDGFRLLQALKHADAPAGLGRLHAIQILRTVWAQQFERSPGSTGAPPDPDQGRSPPKSDNRQPRRTERRNRGSEDHLVSPYDADARFRARNGRDWIGYMLHLIETCDQDHPHLIIHADSTPANVHDVMRLGPIHGALEAKGLLPGEHLVDTGYMSAAHLARSRQQHGIDLVGPSRKDVSWQHRTEGAFEIKDFVVDWDNRRVRCPNGKESLSWGEYGDAARGRYVKVRFRAADCLTCASRARCTRVAGSAQGRQLLLHTRDAHEALVAARVHQQTEAGQRLYALRQGIEGTFSQGVRAFGLRRARYRGLAKTRLQHVATAAALNIERITAWLDGQALAPTRTSRFAALAG
ncbi:IS1182 family transposase [Microvirga sp. VF16]|uniref:IS1182 family transposase n=1 Tax=Microvirga sp. VF16 TaxID=2807101 RepID=UPI00193D0DF4|nr:IS1182 family transposase [Microvirga sp. VF16]QRM35138.1 IS1182 family transposase [Microvirga sp. VF16]